MILKVLQVAGLAVCVYLLWRNVDWRAAAALLAGADLRWFGLAVLLLTLQTALSAERWRITAATLGITLPFLHALREYYLAQTVNQALPGGVLGDAGRAVRARAQRGLLASGQAVLFERIAGQLALLTLLAAGLLFGFMNAGLSTWPSWMRTAAAVFLCSGAFGALALFTILRGGAQLPGVSLFAKTVFGASVWKRQVALSLATATVNIAAFAACAWAIGVPLSVNASITLIPLILFSMVLPLSIGGWGLREGAAVLLFPLAGATPDAGLAASVAFGLAILASLLPGLVLARVGKKGA